MNNTNNAREYIKLIVVTSSDDDLIRHIPDAASASGAMRMFEIVERRIEQSESK
jgi:hypothetical protein